MRADNFRLDDYLRRIGFQGAASDDLATVTQMMQRQLRSVPFENLDVQAGRPVSIVPEAIVSKLIDRQRGGYCYEVNSLFAMALAVLGVPYRLLGARPMGYPKRWARTHMVIAAHIDGKDWLCDTGYGSLSLRQPLDLSLPDVAVRQDHDTYRLRIDAAGEHVVQAKIAGGDAQAQDAQNWSNLYSFNLSPFELVDFIPANYYNSTHPDAIFVQHLLLVRHTDDGRHILVSNSLKTYADGHLSARTLTPDEIAPTVRALFGLKM